MANSVLKGATSGQAWVLAGGTSFISNSIEYGWGSKNIDDFANRTVKNQDFWASTIGDTVVGMATGALAAGIVALGMLALPAAVVATAPVWGVVLATAGVAALIGIGLSAAGVNTNAKIVANAGIDWVQSLFH